MKHIPTYSKFLNEKSLQTYNWKNIANDKKFRKEWEIENAQGTSDLFSEEWRRYIDEDQMVEIIFKAKYGDEEDEMEYDVVKSTKEEIFELVTGDSLGEFDDVTLMKAEAIFIDEFYPEHIRTVIDNLEYAIDYDGTITIYRAMKVPTDYVEYLKREGKHIGICWSYEKTGAQVYDSRGDSIPPSNNPTATFTLVSKIEEKYVNWEETIMLNANLSLGDNEKEIRLYKGTALQIDGIFDEDDEYLDITAIENETFYA